MSDLQRDIEIVDEAVLRASRGIPLYAWESIKARLNPDREAVALAIAESLGGNGVVLNIPTAIWMTAADAAIAAMKGEP